MGNTHPNSYFIINCSLFIIPFSFDNDDIFAARVFGFKVGDQFADAAAMDGFVQFGEFVGNGRFSVAVDG